MLKYCAYCDTKILEKDRHCEGCGAPIKKARLKSKKNNYRSFNTSSVWDELMSRGADLKMNGWSKEGFITLAEKVSAWNSAPPVAFCSMIVANKILPEDPNYRYDIGLDNGDNLICGFMGVDINIKGHSAHFDDGFDIHFDDDHIYITSFDDGAVGKIIGSILIQDGIAEKKKGFLGRFKK